MNSITFFLSFIPILALLLLGVNLIFAPHNPYQEKSSTFECGFHSFLGQNRTQFNISFFIFGLLFLAFDLELVIALPGLINISGISAYGLSIMLIFFAILTIGFAFELGKKALSIDSRQYHNTLNSSLVNNDILKMIIIPVNISIKQYINKFSFINIITGFIILRTITIISAFIISLYIIPGADIMNLAYYIVLSIITYKVLTISWGNNNMVNFIVTLILNCTIITLIISLMLIFIKYNHTLSTIISLSAYFACTDLFGPEFVLMNNDGSPNNGGPSGYNGSGPSGGSGGGPEGPRPLWQPNDNSDNKTSIAHNEKESTYYSDNRQILPHATQEFIQRWFAADRLSPGMRASLDKAIMEGRVPSKVQQISLFKAMNIHFSKACFTECETDGLLKTLLNKMRESNPPLNPEGSKSLTPEMEKEFKVIISYVEKWVQDYKLRDYKLILVNHKNPIPDYSETVASAKGLRAIGSGLSTSKASGPNPKSSNPFA